MGCCQSKESKQVDQDPNPPQKKKDLKDVLNGSQVEEEKEWLSNRKENPKNSKIKEKNNEEKLESTLNKGIFREEKERPKIQISKKQVPQRSNSMINPRIIIKDEEEKKEENNEANSPKTEKKFDVSKKEFEEKDGTIISDTLTLNKNEVLQMNKKSRKLEEENQSLKNENLELKRKLTELMGMSQSELDINKEILNDVLNNKNIIKLERKKTKKNIYKKIGNVDVEDPKEKREKFIENVIENQSKDGDFEIKLSTEEDEEEEEKKNDEEINQEKIEEKNLDFKKKITENLKTDGGKKTSKNDFDRDETIEKVEKKMIPKIGKTEDKIGDNFLLNPKMRSKSKSKLKKMLKETEDGRKNQKIKIENSIEEEEEEDEDKFNERRIDIKNTKLNSKCDKREFLIEKFETEENWTQFLKARTEPVLTQKQMEDYTKSQEKKTIAFKDGSIYHGDFKNGIVHGTGVLKFKNGTVYEGEFEEGFMHGKGKKTFNDGFYYEGEFHKDFMHGIGTLSAPKDYVNYRKKKRNFLKYEGDFAADTRSGKGRFKFSDGSSYTGDVLYGFMHGKGILKSELMHYQGDFKEDQFDGYGVFESKDANPYKYVGNFKEGHKHGRGKLYLGEDKILTTSWEDGLKEGRFTLEAPESVSEGVFEKDEIVGDITTRFSNGDLYVGNCINFYRQGKGRMVWAKHPKLQTYEGDFKENMMHGRGKLVFKTGMIYSGKFNNNRMQGFGKLETAAYTAEGEFFNGKPSGTFIVNFRTGAQYLGKFDGYKRNGFGRIKYTFYEDQRKDLNQSEVSIAGRAIPDEDEEIKETKVEKLYEGWWVDGKKHGKGVLTIGKVVYDGEWRDGKKDGWFDVIRKIGRFKKEKIRVLYEDGRVVKEGGRKEQEAD